MIPHNRPSLGKEEEEAVIRVINTKWLSQGVEVESFENEVCEYLGLPHGHAVAVNSGTSALYIALLAVGCENENVIIPSYVCSAVRNAVLMTNSKAEIVDTDIDSPNINIDQINKSKSKFVIVPHMYGLPVDLNKIHSKIIIEDCCQAMGALYDGKHVGLTGEIGVFSFYATKLITSGGQGGMIISKNKDYIDFIKDYRDFDMKNDSLPRFNFQMTEIQAAIGRVQLNKLNLFLNQREEIFKKYQNAGLNLVKNTFEVKNSNQIHYRAVLKLANPLELQLKLQQNKIKTIIPITEQELLFKTKNALEFSRKTLSLPIYPSLSDVEVNKIISLIP